MAVFAFLLQLISCWYLVHGQGPCPNYVQDNLNFSNGVVQYSQTYNKGRCTQMRSWCKLNLNKQKEADKRLIEAQRDNFQQLKSQHLPIAVYGVKANKACYLVQDGYITLYSYDRKIPFFTAEKLERNIVKNNVAVRKRNTCFRLDPRLTKTQSTTCQAYNGVDKGHIAPSADMSFGDVAQVNTFMFSNMAPQKAKHNRVAWKQKEGYTRDKAKGVNILYAITGTTVDKTIPRRYGTVDPYEFYKLLVWCDANNNVAAEYFFVRHENVKNPQTLTGSTNGQPSMTIAQIQEYIQNKTGIRYSLTTLQCKADGLLGLVSQLQKTITSGKKTKKVTIPVKDAKKVKIKQYKKSTEQSYIREKFYELDQVIHEDSISTGQFCTYIKRTLYSLRNKVTLVSIVKHTVLDLGQEYFNTDCRIEDNDDDLLASIDNDGYSYYGQFYNSKVVTAVVKEGHELRIFDFLNIPEEIDLSAINFKLHNISYNCDTLQLDLHTTPKRFSIIPQFLVLRNSIFSLRMSLNASTYGKIVASFSGHWTLGSLTIEVLARYDNTNKQLIFRGAPTKGLTINIQNLINSLTGTVIPLPFSSFSLTNMAVTAAIDLSSGGLATVVVSGSIGRNRVHAIFQKPVKSRKFSGAFAAEFGPFKLSDLITKTIGVDISQVPFFGSLRVPRLAVTVSSNYITSSLLPKVFCSDELLKYTKLTIPKGLNAFFVLNFGRNKVPVMLHYFQSILSMEVIDEGKLPIDSLLSAIPGVNIRSLILPPGISDIFRIQIDYFELDIISKELEVDISLPETLKYFNGLLTISDPAVKFHAVLKRPRKLFLEVDGSIRIGKGDYEVSISRDHVSNRYILKASFKTIPISNFIHQLSATFLPEEFQNILKKYVQFSIHDAKLAFPLGTRNLQLHLSGTPVFGRHKTVHTNIVIIRQGGQTKLIGGFELGRVNLATLIQKITHKNLRRISILNQELTIAIIISPVSLPGVRLHGNKLKDISILKGVTVQASLQWPQNCIKDKFCAVAQRLLGRGARFTLQGTIESIKKFTLSAGVSNIRLGSGVILQRVALQVTVGIQSSIGIEGSIHLKGPAITLMAGIRVGTRGVVLEGTMQGCWKRAFGANWLSICNLHLLIGIQPTVTIVGALEIGGQVRIGNPSCLRNPIIASGYVGIDQLSPRDNFYYVSVERKLTVQTVLQAFCIRFKLPRPLRESGFPKGFLSSFSLIGKELPKVGISIPSGYRFKGVINILGLEAEADVNIGLPRGVKIKIALPPLKIGKGLLQMYASRNDRSRGPTLDASVTVLPTPNVNIQASGFVHVLGIEVEVMLRVSNTQYELMIFGKFLKLFQAKLHITANYGSIKKAGFRVQGEFKSDFFSSIQIKLKRLLEKLAQIATNVIEKVQRKLNSKKADLDRAREKLSSAQNRVSSANGAFNRAVNTVKGWQKKFRRLCRIERCGKKCIGCPGKWKCLKKVWGKCVFGHPTWRSCCKRFTDPLCAKRNLACSGLRKPVKIGLKAAKKLVDKSRYILKAANAFLNGVKKIFSAAKRSLNKANSALEKVKKKYQSGLKAAIAITKYGSGGILIIKRASFDVALRVAASGHFKLSMTAIVLGKLKRFRVEIYFGSILSFIKRLAKLIIGGFKSELLT